MAEAWPLRDLSYRSKSNIAIDSIEEGLRWIGKEPNIGRGHTAD